MTAPAQVHSSAVTAMLEARSVALVGASARPGSLGARMIEEVTRSPSRPRTYLVNPRYTDIGGVPCLPSLAEVPEPVDLALLAVPDAALEAQMVAAAGNQARSAVIFGSAYGPHGTTGLRDRLAAVARDAGMAVCGAGCMGFVNVTRGLRAIGYVEPDPLPAGPVALVAHSGSVFSALLRARRGFGFTLAVSSGQELVTTAADYARYALTVPGTKVLALVLEAIRDAAGLRAVLGDALAADVPVVLLSVGASEAGQALVAAHSGALAADGGAWEALAAAYGVHCVGDLAELADTLEIFASGRRAALGTGIATVHDSGLERAHTAAATTKPVAVLTGIPAAVDQAAAARLRAAGIPVLEGTCTGLLALRHLLDHAERPVPPLAPEPLRTPRYGRLLTLTPPRGPRSFPVRGVRFPVSAVVPAAPSRRPCNRQESSCVLVCGFSNEELMELASWDGTVRPPLTRVAMLMACGAGLAAVPAGCAPGPGSPGAAASSPAATGTGTAVAIAPFVPIVEPFDPGHPARVESAPDTCGGQSTTLAIEKCYETNTENLDAEINAAQAAKYAKADAAGRAAILSQDSAWLAARGPVCDAAFTGGGTGTIAGISVAACLFDESKARYIAVEGIAPHEFRLKVTDSQDPGALAWYTTPEGSRIAEVSTQGDQAGGSIVNWIIIGGANGFVVNPKQFFYMDSPFTDAGVVQGADPTYHRVATGREYQFTVDYTNLTKDPGRSGGYVYAPGDPVAEWS